jgi:DNA-binding transcriptional regulator YiaG
MKIYTADRETGTFIEEAKNYKDAKTKIRRYEAQDRKDGTYEPNFYAIVDEEHCTIENPGDEVLELRNRAGLSQSAFADFIGCSVRTVQAWEQGANPCLPYVRGLIEYKLKNEGKIKTMKRYYVETNGDDFVAFVDYNNRAYIIDAAKFDERLNLDVAKSTDYSNLDNCETAVECAISMGENAPYDNVIDWNEEDYEIVTKF